MKAEIEDINVGECLLSVGRETFVVTLPISKHNDYNIGLQNYTSASFFSWAWNLNTGRSKIGCWEIILELQGKEHEAERITYIIMQWHDNTKLWTSWVVLLACSDDHIKEYERGKAYNRQEYRVWWNSLKGKITWRPRRRWNVILNWILSRWDWRASTGFLWSRIGTSDGLLTWAQYWNSGLLKIFIS